jgi:hypothetical protein
LPQPDMMIDFGKLSVLARVEYSRSRDDSEVKWQCLEPRAVC